MKKQSSSEQLGLMMLCSQYHGKAKRLIMSLPNIWNQKLLYLTVAFGVCISIRWLQNVHSNIWPTPSAQWVLCISTSPPLVAWGYMCSLNASIELMLSWVALPITLRKIGQTSIFFKSPTHTKKQQTNVRVEHWSNLMYWDALPVKNHVGPLFYAFSRPHVEYIKSVGAPTKTAQHKSLWCQLQGDWLVWTIFNILVSKFLHVGTSFSLKSGRVAHYGTLI